MKSVSNVGSVIKWLECCDCGSHDLNSKLMPFYCVLGKDTFQHFSLLDGLGKQLLNFSNISIKPK